MSPYRDVSTLARAMLVGLALFGAGWWARDASGPTRARSAVEVAACAGLSAAIDAWYASPERRGADVPQSWSEASSALGGCH